MRSKSIERPCAKKATPAVASAAAPAKKNPAAAKRPVVPATERPKKLTKKQTAAVVDLARQKKTAKRTAPAAQAKKSQTKSSKQTQQQQRVAKIEFVLTDPYSPYEMRDAMAKISSKSPLHRRVMDTIYSDSSVYTMRGRLNKSRLCEILDIKPKELNRVLLDARELLGTPVER